ncbi:MAG: hypothetical protein IKE58_04045 [Blautia sp.]|nr:hypothetical protein [Blautia sp.]
MKKHRILSAALAAALAAASIFTTAWAEPATLKEARELLMQSEIEAFESSYDAKLDAQEASMKGSNAKLTLTVEQPAKDLLSMIFPLDLSWLKDITFDAKASIKDHKTVSLAQGLVNDTPVISMNVMMDMESLDYFTAVPTLTDGVLKANYEDVIALSLEQANEDLPFTAEQITSLMKVMFSFIENPPAAADITKIINKYGAILLDMGEDVELTPDTVTVEGISQELLTAEQKITATQAQETVLAVLSALQEDEQLRDLYTSYAEDASSYDTFMESIKELYDNVANEDMTDETMLLVLRCWFDADANLAGLALSQDEDGYITPFVTCLAPSTEDAAALSIVAGEDENFSLVGSGTIADGMLSGSYLASFEGEPVADIAVTDYAVDAYKENAFSGTYNITVAGTEQIPFLSNLGITVDVDTTAEGGNFDLTVNSNGTPLLTLRSEAAISDEPVDYEVPADAPIYDFTKEEDIEAFNSSVDPSPIFTNLMEAGMPEDFLESIFSMFG